MLGQSAFPGISGEAVHHADRPFRVLSLDGGGMRGLYTASLLSKLVQLFAPANANDVDLGKAFDLIVGTSTGGIIACALATGVPLRDITTLYREAGPEIFPNPMPSPQKWVRVALWAKKHINKPLASQARLAEMLDTCFGDETVAGVYTRRGIALCIPSVNITTHKARVFKTPHNPDKQLDNPYKLRDICLATSAAPIFFPLAVLDDPYDSNGAYAVYTDGGLWANNPVIVGLTEALELAGEHQKIEILSVGTCPPPKGNVIERGAANRGIAQWKAGIGPLDAALDAQSHAYNEMARLLANNLKRECEVVRLESGQPSGAQAQHLGLDSASPQALQIMMSLAEEDAKRNHSLALDPAKQDYKLVADIFKNLETFQA